MRRTLATSHGTRAGQISLPRERGKRGESVQELCELAMAWTRSTWYARNPAPFPVTARRGLSTAGWDNRSRRPWRGLPLATIGFDSTRLGRKVELVSRDAASGAATADGHSLLCTPGHCERAYVAVAFPVSALRRLLREQASPAVLGSPLPLYSAPCPYRRPGGMEADTTTAEGLALVLECGGCETRRRDELKDAEPCACPVARLGAALAGYQLRCARMVGRMLAIFQKRCCRASHGQRG